MIKNYVYVLPPNDVWGNILSSFPANSILVGGLYSPVSLFVDNGNKDQLLYDQEIADLEKNDLFIQKTVL